MAKKKETGASSKVLNALKKHGYFRKISDRVQVGIPDVIGSFKGRFTGVEVKAVSEIPSDGKVPKKGSHPFDKVQVNNLEEIHKNKGIAVGLVVCGNKGVFAFYNQIDEEGRIDWNDLWDHNQFIEDVRDLSETLEWIERLIVDCGGKPFTRD